MAFHFTGFADEAGKPLKDQIDATKRAGWSSIEVRAIDGTFVTDMADAAFGAALDTLQSNEIQVAGFGAQLANWSRPITTDFQLDVDEMKRAIPRMHKCKTKFIRCMSYPHKDLERDAYKKEVFRRLKVLAKMAEDGGVILAHENCSGFGGEGPDQSLEMVAAVNSPAFKLIFDSGNNAMHDNDQNSTWTFYNKVKEHVVHVHLKAAKPGPDGKLVTCYPDEDPTQLKVLTDLKKRGYDGWLSIEPHMAAAIHAGKQATDSKAASDIYVEYAKRTVALAAKA
jgi:sugar phosphate isomerase/epimerase